MSQYPGKDGKDNEINGEPMNKANSLVSFMECPVCFDISVPILQCSNGHIICKECWESLTVKSCPTCRVIISESPI